MVNKKSRSLKSLQYFRLNELSHYFIYQLQKKTGVLRRLTPIVDTKPESQIELSSFFIPDRKVLRSTLGADESQLIDIADRIVSGEYQAFGAIWKKLDFSQQSDNRHWLLAERDYQGKDIKWDWEPARFGWAIQLARAYWLTGDKKYTETFWKQTDDFMRANPVNTGIHWVSGQEIAIRMLSIMMSFNVFRQSEETKQDDISKLTQYLFQHANRIPKTIHYAIAQNNNHLFSEAAGLVIASLLFPDVKESKHWHSLGMKWLIYCFKNQFYFDGAYIQQSTNYHRLVLHLILLLDFFFRQFDQEFQAEWEQQWLAATDWLIKHSDRVSGAMINLGHNDGALILPLTVNGFRDVRPALQACTARLQGKAIFEQGTWDELSVWLNISGEYDQFSEITTDTKVSSESNWMSVRAVNYQARPAHADQNHVEFWYQGENLLRDPGTFAYNLAFPWDNRLTTTQVHNTIMINGQDQMDRVSKFRWENWSKGKIVRKSEKLLISEHDGYKRYNLKHTRTLALLSEDHWQITDLLKKNLDKPLDAYRWQIHFLVKDSEVSIIDDREIIFHFQSFSMKIKFCSTSVKDDCGISLYKAGELLTGNRVDGIQPLFGWYSPTYGIKEPALSLIYAGVGLGEMSITTDIQVENC